MITIWPEGSDGRSQWGTGTRETDGRVESPGTYVIG